MYPPIMEEPQPSPFTPRLPAGIAGPNPAAAIAARKRKNEKRDEQRKAGAQALRTVAGQNSTADAPPQYTPPPGPAPQQGPPVDPATGKPMAAPQMQSPDFKPAEYVPPKKGLEYLALGLGLLFPGAPIARIASGFSGGLQQGAQQKYERAEHTAEQQFKVAEAKAHAEYQNAQARYGVASDEAKRAYVNLQEQRGVAKEKAEADFANAKVRYDAAQQQRARGTDPKTGQPFVVPPALQAPLPPNAGVRDHAMREHALSQFYTSVGATDIAAQHAAQAKEYVDQAKQQQSQAASLMRTMYTVQHADARAYAHMAQSAAIHADSEARADAREEYRARRDDLRDLRQDATHRDALRTQAFRLGNTFEHDYVKAITEQKTYNPDGTEAGIKKPATISDPGLKKALAQAFQRITKDADPVGLAQHIADATFKMDDPASATAKSLLVQRAEYAELTRKSQGLPVLPKPEAYYAALDRQAQQHMLKSIGLNLNDPRVKSWMDKLTQAGIDPSSPEALAAIKADLAGKSTKLKRDDLLKNVPLGELMQVPM